MPFWHCVGSRAEAVVAVMATADNARDAATKKTGATRFKRIPNAEILIEGFPRFYALMPDFEDNGLDIARKRE